METKSHRAQDEGRKARFDAFFDFYFPRLYGYLVTRTKERRSAELLTRMILERAVDQFDRGDIVDHAAWILDLAECTLAERERARAPRRVQGRKLGVRPHLQRR